MVDEPFELPAWIRDNDLIQLKQRPGASLATIRSIEQRFAIRLPRSYCDFLRYSDGFYVVTKFGRVSLYGIELASESTTVEKLNSLSKDSPLFIIGIDDREIDLGFRWVDIQHDSLNYTLPVFAYVDGEVCATARSFGSFEEFIMEVALLHPDIGYEPGSGNLDGGPANE